MKWFRIRVQRCWDHIDLQSFRGNGRSTLVFFRQLSSSPATQLQLSSNLYHKLHRPVAATPAPTRLTSSSPNSTSHQTLLLSRNHRNEDNEQ
ncbi:hypothetical protein ACFX1T_007963 [Malus domestica]